MALPHPTQHAQLNSTSANVTLSAASLDVTALSSLGIRDNIAHFSSKANITDVTDPLNPISLEGNAMLQLWLTDNGEAGTSDTLGVQVLSKNGGLWFSSNWGGTKTIEQTSGGGNLASH